MKKIIKLTESELIKVVKRIISEDMTDSPNFKRLVVNYIDKLVKDGLYAEQGLDNNEDYILFRNSETDEIVFRYSIHDGTLLYSDKINDFPHGMFGSHTWKELPYKYNTVGEIVREWAEENLVPEFSEDVEEITGEEFYIDEIYNDENYDPYSGTHFHQHN